MSKLAEYVMSHVDRGACQCGKCFDAPANPEEKQPLGHTADLVFFKVSAVNEPKADELRALIAQHKGDYEPVNPLDGKEHNYLELGGYMGDQGLALMLMGLGSLLGLWRLLTPKSLGLPDDLAMQMAGSGMISVQATPETVAA